MAKPEIRKFNEFAIIKLAKYERYLPTAFDESLSLLEKMNKLIHYLNEMGLILNEVVKQWNEVMEWVMNDGLTEAVSDKLDEMVEDGTLDRIINEKIFGELERKIHLNTERINDIYINVKKYGAIGDGVKNDTQAINDAIDVIKDLSLTGAKPTLYFPYSAGYLVNETIRVPRNVNIMMMSDLIYDGTQSALIIGEPGSQTQHVNLELQVFKKDQSDWEDGSKGFIIYNANTCHIKIKRAVGFQTGYELIADGTGFSYNEIVKGFIYNNKIGEKLVTKNGGWINENQHYGGRFTNLSTLHPYKDRYGTIITSEFEYYSNNNVFNKPSYELQNPTGGEALPIVLEYATLNTFKNVRNENNGPVLVRILNNSTENDIESGYGHANIDDQSRSPMNISSPARRKKTNNKGNRIFDSGDLFLKTIKANAENSVFIKDIVTPGVLYDPVIQNGIEREGDYVKTRGDRGVAIYVNTEQAKEFVVRKDTLPSFGGRLCVKPYDANGNAITTGNPVRGSSALGFTLNTTQLNGVYETGENRIDVFFKVSEEVKEILIYLRGGVSDLKIKSFVVDALDGYTSATTKSMIKDSGLFYSETEPSETEFRNGQTIYNLSPREFGPTGSRYIINGWTYVDNNWIQNRVLTGN